MNINELINKMQILLCSKKVDFLRLAFNYGKKYESMYFLYEQNILQKFNILNIDANCEAYKLAKKNC